MKPIARRTALLTIAGSVASALAAPAIAQRAKMVAATQLGWLRNGEFAPLIVAEQKGFFDAEGISHHIMDGGPGKNPIPIVAVGQAQFGLATSALHILAARSARDPVDIVGVGALYQNTPSALLTLRAPEDPDPTPKDLEGKTVGMQAGSEYFVTALARKNGIDESKIKIVTALATPEPLMLGRIDFFSGWVTNQTYLIEQEAAKPDAPPTLKGKTWKALRFGSWGLASYGDTIFTTPKVIKEQPELVPAYLRAVARGIQYILDNPDDAIKVVAAAPGQIEDVAKLTWRWRQQNPLFTSDDTKLHGPLWMTTPMWDQMAQFLKDVNQIPAILPTADAMTQKFLPGGTTG
jgi:NitT/TauT family transport system substrate-binding protein